MNISFEFDENAGEIREGNIRYLLMRPDVLMGMVEYLDEPTMTKVLLALQKSAFENGRASLRQYNELDFASDNEKLSFVCKTAAKLGWGNLTYTLNRHDDPTFTLTNSPFAKGHGISKVPVCAPMAGILNALMEVFFESNATVKEVSCASQGQDYCLFEVRSSSE